MSKSLTKAHFQEVAELFDGRPYSYTANDVAEWLAEGLAEIYKRENPNFDRTRFMLACGFTP